MRVARPCQGNGESLPQFDLDYNREQKRLSGILKGDSRTSPQGNRLLYGLRLGLGLRSGGIAASAEKCQGDQVRKLVKMLKHLG